MKRLFLVLLWFPTTLITLLFVLGYYSYHNNIILAQNKDNPKSLTNIPYQFYASLPKVLGAETINTFHVESQDVLPELIYSYMYKHKSPMLNTSEDLIKAAEKYELDPLFLVAIAQCESNLGKKMPHVDENNPTACHNPFGWGIHKRGTLCFDTWQEGYEKVAKGLREKYFDEGYETTEDIMTKYTPPALEKGGSWAKCVNKFLGELNEIKDEM